MNEQEKLSELLRRSVPEAPTVDATAIRRYAERQRRTGNGAIAAGAVGVLAVAAAAIGMAGNDRSGDQTQPGPAASSSGPTTASPYDVPCPMATDQGERPEPEVRSLRDLKAVRLCLDYDPRRPGTQPPVSADDLAEQADADALVSGLATFAAAVRDLPKALPEYCTTSRGPWVQQVLVFRDRQGRDTVVSSVGCETVEVEGRQVEGGALRNLFVEALDRQRDELTYTRGFDDPLTCQSRERGGPVKPGRERLIAAVLCDLPADAESIPPDLKPTPLTASQLVKLNQAWQRPGDPIVRDATGLHPCVDGLSEPPSFIMAATDRSDVIRLEDSPCGFLVWLGDDLHLGATIPTTPARLGLP